MTLGLASDNGNRRVQACQEGSGSRTTGAALVVYTGNTSRGSGHQATWKPYLCILVFPELSDKSFLNRLRLRSDVANSALLTLARTRVLLSSMDFKEG